MKNYEYEVMGLSLSAFNSREQLKQYLNELGKVGWELVETITKQEAGTSVYFTFIFKRELA